MDTNDTSDTNDTNLVGNTLGRPDEAMSLTSHLSDPASPIGQFIKQRFVQTTRLTKAANLQLKVAETLRPALPGISYPYAPIGTAIDYRIRYAFDVTPYQQLVAW